MTGKSTATSSAQSFATQLRTTMFDRRVSVGQLARETDIPERLIRKYRAGTTEPRDHFRDPTENAQKIADALDVAVDVLLPPAPRPEETAA